MYDLHEKKTANEATVMEACLVQMILPDDFLASSLQFSGVNSAEKFHDISIHQHHAFFES